MENNENTTSRINIFINMKVWRCISDIEKSFYDILFKIKIFKHAFCISSMILLMPFP